MDGAPQRPPDLPEGSIWVGEAGEWRHGAVDERGEKQGVHRSWRPDGTLREEVCFVDGRGVGRYRRFHPNAALAGEGEFVDGHMQGTLRTFACDAPTPEQLQPCCVPANAWELQTDYHRGEVMARRWYDRQGRQILDSGEPHPPRPASVPAHARYDEASARWLVGSYQAGAGQVAHWRRWSRDGVLAEEEDLADGLRHGVWRRFDGDGDGAGVLLLEAHYERGLRHGPFRDRAIDAAGYRDGRAADEEGQFERGQAVGRWTLRDSGGVIIAERDLGGAVADETLAASPVFADDRDLGDSAGQASARLAALAGALCAQRRPGEAIVAMARSAALSGDAGALRRLIDQVTWPRAAPAAHDIAATVIETEGQRLAALVDALVRGGDAPSLLRALASAMNGAPQTALHIVDGALLLAPELPACRLTRALINVHLGARDAALADAGRLPDDWDDQRRNLVDYIRVIFPTFDFWPGRTAVTTVFEEFPQAPAQPLQAIRAVAQRYATRLAAIRAALVARAKQQPAWLPPALPALLPDGPVALGAWEFQQRFDDGDDGDDGESENGSDSGDTGAGTGTVEQIAVDERLALDTASTPALLGLARREWAALAWLCWSCGLDRVALPDAVAAPDDFGRAAAMSIERTWRCRDKLASGGLVAMSKGVPGFEWEGLHVDVMPRAVAEVMTDEHVEVRAMFLWLCDATAQSPWQSDLRGE